MELETIRTYPVTCVKLHVYRRICCASSTSNQLDLRDITNATSKWNRKRYPFTAAKLSSGDIMATDMHASDACAVIQL